MGRAAKTIVLATVGSLGDLHPFIAVGLKLKERGFDPLLAVPQANVEKVERAGLRAHAIFPDFHELGVALGVDTETATKRLMRDPDFLVRRALFDRLAETAAKLEQAAQGAAAIVTATFAPGEMVGEKLGIPVIPAVLQPYMMFSAHEPPASREFWMLRQWPKTDFDVAFNRASLRMINIEMRRRYAGVVNRVRRANGLGPAKTVPVFGLAEGPLTLALYSPLLGPPMPDHPPNTVIAGTAFFDSDSGAPEALDAEAEAFFGQGEPPLVFTLGSFAVYAPGDFYAESLAAARRLKRRAVLLTGPGKQPPPAEDVLIRAYAPHSLVFPRAAAVIHHGGAGTTAQAMRAGKPQIVVPHMGDQWDHGARIERLGAGKVLKVKRYTAASAADTIGALLADARVAERAREVGRIVSAERGAENAAEAIARVVG